MYLISYDIEGNSLRTRISDKLIAEGLLRIQYSVFLGEVAPSDFNQLKQWLVTNLKKGNPQKDTVFVIHLTKTQVESALIIGHNKYDIDEIIGKKSTFIL